jgi:hypothetical protein
MIAAAKADGEVTPAERQRILDELAQTRADAEERVSLQREMIRILAGAAFSQNEECIIVLRDICRHAVTPSDRHAVRTPMPDRHCHVVRVAMRVRHGISGIGLASLYLGKV